LSGVVAQKWLEKYRTDDGLALLELINCVLQCIGSEHEITIDDIRDPENIPNRLEDLQKNLVCFRCTVASVVSDGTFVLP